LDEQELISRLKAGDLDARQEFWNRYKEPTYQMICRAVRPRTFQDPRTHEWTRDLSDAQDILSKTLLKALHSITRFQGKCPLQNWLYVIASNTARSFYREEARHHPKAVAVGNGDQRHPDSHQDGNGQDQWPLENSEQQDGGNAPLDDSSQEYEGNMNGIDIKDGDPKISGRNRRKIELSAFAADAANSWGSNDESETYLEIEKLMAQLSEEHRLVLTLRGFNGMSVKETAGIMGITDEAVRSLKYRASAQLAKLWDPAVVSEKGGQSND
jgi:RNA polymerase sigma factor (sigma-70 family)